MSKKPTSAPTTITVAEKKPSKAKNKPVEQAVKPAAAKPTKKATSKKKK